MEAKELRIGNFLYFNGNHKHIGVVTSIQPKNIVKCCRHVEYSDEIKIGLNNRFDILYNIEDVKPIPLTKEILLKCKGTLNGYIYKGWDDMQFFRFDNYNPNVFELEILDDSFYYGKNKIEFLHDLQNCYFFHENNKKELTVNF